MEKFSYIAIDKTNKETTGFEEALDQDELIARLQARDLIVLSVSSETGEGLIHKAKTTPLPAGDHHLTLRRYRIGGDDLVIFCRQLATLLGAGVTVLKSLDVISKQVSSRRLYSVIRDLQKNMEQGLSLHEAMSKHSKVFSDLWVNLVESGEAGGNLPVVLSRLASYLERNASFKKRIISALIYPAILLLAGLGALLFLTIKIIPTFADLFKGFNITLPFLTQVLIDISSFLRKNIITIIVIAGSGFFLLRRYIKTRDGRLHYERFQFNLPVFGEFFRALVVEKFSSNMATLVESGVPILYSLEITERSVDNLVMAGVVRQIKENVREGKSLSRPMEESGFFEPMVVQMVSIGEEIGELPQMLKKINIFYQEYVETFLMRFTSMFEPLMLIFLGLIIGLMVIGLFLPIFKIAQMGGNNI